VQTVKKQSTIPNEQFNNITTARNIFQSSLQSFIITLQQVVEMERILSVTFMYDNLNLAKFCVYEAQTVKK
jgi:hypothetical protein